MQHFDSRISEFMVSLFDVMNRLIVITDNCPQFFLAILIFTDISRFVLLYSKEQSPPKCSNSLDTNFITFSFYKKSYNLEDQSMLLTFVYLVVFFIFIVMSAMQTYTTVAFQLLEIISNKFGF